MLEYSWMICGQVAVEPFAKRMPVLNWLAGQSELGPTEKLTLLPP